MVFHIELLLIDLVICVLEDGVTINLNRVDVPSIMLLLQPNQMLEDLRPQTERNGVRDVDKDGVAYLAGDVLVVQMVEPL